VRYDEGGSILNGGGALSLGKMASRLFGFSDSRGNGEKRNLFWLFVRKGSSVLMREMQNDQSSGEESFLVVRGYRTDLV